MGVKRCVDCETEGIKTKRQANYPGPRCHSHHKRIKSSRRAAVWERRIGETYNLSPERYWRLYKAQGGVCAICRRATGKTRKLAVDHDHSCCAAPMSCGECVRGLCCSTCNNFLGHVRDEPAAGDRIRDYLNHPPAKDIG